MSPTRLPSPSPRNVLRGQFEERIEGAQAVREWRQAGEAFHDRLYYYCSARTLTDVMKSRTLWGTDLRHMNDSSELRYGGRLVAARLAAVKSRVSQEDQAFLDDLAPVVNPLASDYDAYGCCFSEEPDDLTQWRAYGDGGRGYNIGFAADGLRHKMAVRTSQLEKPWFGRVVYDLAEQTRLVDDALNAAVELAREVRSAQPPHPHYADHVLRFATRQVMGGIVPFLKDPRFRAENEWRIVVLGLPPLDAEEADDFIDFRESDRRIFPYMKFRARPIEVNLNDPYAPTLLPYDEKADPMPLPIVSIRAGRLVPLEAEEHALRLLLAKAGLPPGSIEVSKIPMQ